MKIAVDNLRAQSLIYAGLVTIGLVTSSFFASHPDSRDSGDRTVLTCHSMPTSKLMTRTDLFFGSSKPNGKEISNIEFQQFIDREVTSRFPNGFTLLSGDGQFKNDRGIILKERSHLLILLYPGGENNNQQIEQIRKAYVTAFQQQSVLRADESTCASF